MFLSIELAFSQMFSKPFRSVFWKAIGLTFLMLFFLWSGIQGLVGYFLAVPYPWLDAIITWATGIGMIIGLGFFIAPVTSMFAGLFLDEIAEKVEGRYYKNEKQGTSMPFMQSLGSTIKFAFIVLAVNFLALILFFFFGLGIPIFFIANGYLLGREYFEMAAQRFMPSHEARALRSNHAAYVFMAGLVIAGFLAIPFLNLLTPLFATAFMVHIYKKIAGSKPSP